MCLEMLSYFCIFAPVANTGAAMQRQSQTDRSVLMAKGNKIAFLWSKCQDLCKKMFLACKSECVCRRGQFKRFLHINQINRSNKEIPSPSEMGTIQTFRAVYDYNLRRPPKQHTQTVSLLYSPPAEESLRKKKRASVMRSEGILVGQKCASALSARE